MRKIIFSVLGYILVVSICFANSSSVTKGFIKGTPTIQSLSALAFGTEGVLFIGDSRGGSVFAVDLDDKIPNHMDQEITIENIEGKIANMLGTTVDQILIHDLAVNPLRTATALL